MANAPKTWNELTDRLRLYAVAASTLGGMNDLDAALHQAAEGIDALKKHVPEHLRKEVGGFDG